MKFLSSELLEPLRRLCEEGNEVAILQRDAMKIAFKNGWDEAHSNLNKVLAPYFADKDR